MDNEVPNSPPRDAIGKLLATLNGQDAMDTYHKKFQELFNSPEIAQDPFQLYLVLKLEQEKLVNRLHSFMSASLDRLDDRFGR